MRFITFLLLSLLSVSSFADFKPYASVGAAYKVKETYIVDLAGDHINNVDTAQFEVGVENGNFSFGWRHVSNWSAGWPINDENEYAKDEFFIEYKVYLDVR